MDEGMDKFEINIKKDFKREIMEGREKKIKINVDEKRMRKEFKGGGYVK